MNKDLNKVMIIGRVQDEGELRHTPGGHPVTSFSVSTTRTWTSSEGETREETEWFNVVAWGNLADLCHKQLARGQRVYLEGRLQTRGWEDDQGRRQYRTEVVASEMIPLSN